MNAQMDDFADLDSELSPESLTDRSFRKRVGQCRWAFTLAALGLGVQTIDLALGLIVNFNRGRGADPGLRKLVDLVDSPQWSWWVGTPITWLTLIASYFLIGKFKTATWNSRAIPLAMMNTIDLGLWFIAHAREMGLENLARLLPPFSIARYALQGLQWFELLCFATLCAEYGTRLGYQELETGRHVARASAICGFSTWCLLMVSLLSWHARGLQFVGWRERMQWHMFHSMSMAILMITVFNVTCLCLRSARRGQSWLLNQLPRESIGADVSVRTAESDFLKDWKERDRNAFD